MALQTMVDTDNTNYAQDLDGELSSTGYSVRKVLEILEKNSEDYVSLKNGQDIVNVGVIFCCLLCCIRQFLCLDQSRNFIWR